MLSSQRTFNPDIDLQEGIYIIMENSSLCRLLNYNSSATEVLLMTLTWYWVGPFSRYSALWRKV